jgi:hypothetical protein
MPLNLFPNTHLSTHSFPTNLLFHYQTRFYIQTRLLWLKAALPRVSVFGAAMAGHDIDRINGTLNLIPSAQALSGTGALRIAGEFFKKYQSSPASNFCYVSNPTWGNHNKLFAACGIEVREYGPALNLRFRVVIAIAAAGTATTISRTTRSISVVLLKTFWPCLTDPSL